MKHLSSINEVAHKLKLYNEILQVKLALLQTLGKNKFESLDFIQLFYFPVTKSSDVFIRVKNNLDSRKKKSEQNIEAVSGLVKRMLKCNIV